MARMLASSQKVWKIEPIEGADRIELAHVLGWQCVVKKGTFKEGDLGVYIEIDSIVPDTPIFAFMKDRKFRVKTIKLKGQISQGLLMPFADLGISEYSEGKDLTDIVGVTKYDPEEVVVYKKQPKSFWQKLIYRLPFLSFLRKKVGEGAAFPTHLVPKTDETRLQAFGPEFLEQYKDLIVTASVKMDGSSCTFIYDKGKFSVASRNVWFIEKKDNNFWKIAEETNIARAMKKLFGKRRICLQGELCGPGIQGNKYKFDSLMFFLFGAFDSDKQEYFTPEGIQLLYLDLVLSGARTSFHIVPSVFIKEDNVFSIQDVGTNIEDWLKLASSKSCYNQDTWNEGIVVRSVDNKPYGVRGMEGGRFSFKVISNEFLLQYGL